MSHSSKRASSHKQFWENPNVIYPNGASLSRPMKIPDSYNSKIIALLIAACIIAAAMVVAYFSTIPADTAQDREQVQVELSKDVALNLPTIISFVSLDDASIMDRLNATGETFYEKPASDDGYFEVVKIPSDMTLVDAAALYAVGIDNLSAAQAVSFLNGSWILDVDRAAGLNMSIHYADFKTASLEDAIAYAIEDEEFDRGSVTDSGDNDGNGNAFTTGTIMVSGDEYTWTVSAAPLKSVYSVSGLPDDAVYVGIRIRGA